MPHDLVSLLTRSVVAITILMLAVWLLSIIRKDASIVDIAWGLGFVVVAWVCLLFDANRDAARSPGCLLPVLTTLLGVRLSAYLFWRNHGKPEDYRYRAMREKWGTAFPLVSLVTVFALQGLIMWVVSLPVQVGTALADRDPSPATLIGIALWAIGLFFESVGDWQLARFKSQPRNKGKVLDTGLWRYTRHPNYFGDFLIWWGLFLISLSLTRAWWTIIGPLIMSIFLMRVSGVTLLERSLTQTKPEYADYIRRTNAFFPCPPRNVTDPQ
jgi:steroid 5-alpha reductase family enzyme